MEFHRQGRRTVSGVLQTVPKLRPVLLLPAVQPRPPERLQKKLRGQRQIPNPLLAGNKVSGGVFPETALGNPAGYLCRLSGVDLQIALLLQFAEGTANRGGRQMKHGANFGNRGQAVPTGIESVQNTGFIIFGNELIKTCIEIHHFHPVLSYHKFQKVSSKIF